MSNDLGFGVPLSRRNLTALRSALESLETGASVTALFRYAEHGQFTVSGPVRRDLTETVLKVGWWDLTNGKKVEPVAELQSLASLVLEDDLPELATADDDELRSVVSSLDDGDVVTADFDFEGCGRFTLSGGVRRDQHGTRWVLAGHHLTLGDAHAPRVRRLVVERKAAVPVAVGGQYDLFGG
ncbi:hypothetical protein [Oerskovia sp. KBS0722]|uniref:hypothetical protein n=1 Tax=Oerskovia sp. KBS0722 TaxID=1179673 RepID=UPI00110F3F5F|nr:hypothetical protein [Oerskovia sp. KBS0722]QDW63568.1 hypothetical protein FFI11_014590 [Oerskovia sp. KBS0722]